MGEKARICLAFFVLSAFCLGGCSTIPHPPEPEPSAASEPPVSAPPALPPFALSFSKEDSLHPYKAQSRANLDLASLLYEGLTAVGGDYAVRLNLAASIDEGEPLRPVVAIRSDAHFSDGSPVTVRISPPRFRPPKARRPSALC